MDDPHGASMTKKRIQIPRVAVVLAVLAIVAAACSGDYDRFSTTSASNPTTTSPSTTLPPPTTTTEPPDATTTTTEPGSTTTQPPPPPEGPGRIAVVTTDRGLITVRADGSDVAVLQEPATGSAAQSPTWSNDASEVVWTSLSTNSVLSRRAPALGGTSADLTISPPPYVYLWTQDDSLLATLRALSTTATELGLVDPATNTASPVERGFPLSAAWSPDGSQLVVNSGEELLLVDRSGGVTPMGLRAGLFGAPAWLDDTHVLVAIQLGDKQYLSLVDVIEGTRRDLVAYDGAIRFVLDTTAGRVAYEVLPDSGGGTADNVARRGQVSPTTTIPAASEDQLSVLDLATGNIESVIDSLAAAFVWDPVGDRLAYLTPEDNGAMQWHFWNADDVIDGPVFGPHQDFLLQYLPLFDQYAQSIRWWAPDGSSFVFGGRIGPQSGIWVQRMDQDADASFLVDGDIAVWSPR